MGVVGFIKKQHREIVHRLKYLFWGRRIVAGFVKTILPIIRRVLPNVIATELVGVQPMSGPMTQVFTLRHRYGQYGIPNGEENIHFHWGLEMRNMKNTLIKVLLS